MLNHLVNNVFERTQLDEPDITFYDELQTTTSVQDISNQTMYVLETRNSGTEALLDFDNAYLMVKYKIVKTNGTDYDNVISRVSLVRSAWDLFASVQIELNRVRIDYCDWPGEVANIMLKTSKSYDYLVDNSRILGYYPAGVVNSISNGTTVATDSTDSNWLAGALESSESVSIWKKLPLNLVLGLTNIKKVLTGVNLVVRLEKNTDYNRMLMRSAAGENTDGKTVIEEIQMFCPAMKLAPKKQAEFIMELKAKPMIIDWQQIYFYRMEATGNNLQLNLFTGAKAPRHLIVCPQLSSVNASQLNQNGGCYASTNVTDMFVTINGTATPFIKYNGANNGYLREVTAIKRAFGKDKGGDGSSIIRPDNFEDYNSIFYFDLSKFPSLFQENNQSDVIVKINFVSSQAGAQTFNCLLLHNMHHKMIFQDGLMTLAQS